MRPVDRGPVPLDSKEAPKEYSDYKKARGDLINCLGEYCSYCEMHHDAPLDVEHIQPKSLHPELEREWTNFLLACRICNSIKSNQEVNLDDFFWPDKHNTFMAIEYAEGGVVRPHPSLQPSDRTRAENLIKLVGLDRRARSASHSDHRWINRMQWWDEAALQLSDWRKNPSPELARSIVRTVKASGYWSVWMTVFRDEPEMLSRFIAEVPGTAKDCFDQRGQPMPRNQGQV